MAQQLDTNGQSGDVTTMRPHERFVEYMVRRAEVEGPQMASEVSGDSIDKIVTAQTVEDVWAADEGGTISGQDFEDVEHRINSFMVAPSSDEYSANLGVYVAIKATLLQEYDGKPPGTEVTIVTGAASLIAKLRMFEQMNALPIDGIIKGTKTAKGTLLRYRPVPKRAITVTAE